MLAVLGVTEFVLLGVFVFGALLCGVVFATSLVSVWGAENASRLTFAVRL